MQKKAQRNIPMLDLKAQHAEIGRDVEAAVKRVLESQQFINGPEVRELERQMAAYCKCAEAVGCASGSDALLLALMAAGVGAGDEVITTSFSFFATAGSIVRLGARPVFVDIDPGTFNIDASRIEQAVTPKTKAIMPVHLFGQCADMDLINEVAARHNLAVIEDAAQAIGAEYRGKRAGGLGHVAAFSFYPSKNLGAAGDGGALTTNSLGMAELLRTLRAHGAKRKYYHDLVGINSRLDTLQAAILLVKMSRLDDWAGARRGNAARYRELFAKSGLLEKGAVRLPAERDWAFHIYNQFVIRAVRRDELRTHLSEAGIGTEIYYPVPLHLQPCFSDLGYRQGDLPESELASKESLAIPVYPELGAAAQERIVDALASFYQG